MSSVFNVFSPCVRRVFCTALDGGKSGLDIVRLLLSAALPWPCPVGQAEPAQATLLRDGGKICLELDVDQPLRLRRLMLQAHTGPWWLADESTEPSADCGGVPISRPVGLRREGEAGGLRNIISIAKSVC